MNRQVRVPIQVRRSANGPHREVVGSRQSVAEAKPAVVELKPTSTAAPGPTATVPSRPESDATRVEHEDELRAKVEEWRDRALRLQAEMENFRKRQQRLAEERIETNQGRLLRSFLTVADDLERALNVESSDNQSLREGVELTYRSLQQLLKQEGVERTEAKGETFDPAWHEAVATVPHEEAGVDEDIIVEVAQQGYHVDGRLLRPARVVVAT